MINRFQLKTIRNIPSVMFILKANPNFQSSRDQSAFTYLAYADDKSIPFNKIPWRQKHSDEIYD